MGRKTIRIFGFPYHVSAEDATQFLENYAGKGTVSALKIRQSKRTMPNPKAFAVVQFKDIETADRMFHIIDGRLKYELSELRVSKMAYDIVPEPRAPLLSLDATALYFGCQICETRFHVFEKVADAVLKFRHSLRTVKLQLTYCDIEYKLELSYDSIWRIHGRSPWNHDTKFIVLQILAAPQIYEKCSSRQSVAFSNYFKHTPEDEWIRTTDFTVSSSIGQSAAICLELHQSCMLHSVSEQFQHYRENDSAFILDYGSSLSQSFLLGPSTNPPHGLELPYEILFKVNSLVQNGCLAGPILDAAFFRLVNPEHTHISHIRSALEKMYYLKAGCYEPVRWLTEQYRTLTKSKKSSMGPYISLDDGLIYIRRVQVTPTKMYFCGPEATVSNRVLRNFHHLTDNFIRVSFVDEDGEKMRSTDLCPSPHSSKQHTTIYDRIRSTLENGIRIGNKRFDFLAFSSSQLRENSTWMFASKDGVRAATIRDWIGDFRDIRNVAKYAARLGLSFGSSIEALTVHSHEVDIVPDIETQWKGNKYVFSDGIGTISSELAKRVAKTCGIVGSTPSAFQIRYAGYKGVVAAKCYTFC